MAKKATSSKAATKTSTTKKTTTTKKSTTKSSTKIETPIVADYNFLKYPEITERRLHQIRFMIEDQKLDAMVVSHIPNVRYLTGFSGSSGYLFILPEELHFVTDDRYAESIKNELYDLPNLEVHIARNVWEYAKKSKILKKVKFLGFEADRLPYSVAVEIRNIIRPVKFKPAPNEVEPFTMPKDPMELGYIKEACRIAEDVYSKILKKIKVGMTEKDLANDLIFMLRKSGSEGLPFEPIVVSGPRTSLPHGIPSDKKIKKNDLITLDFGARVNGFGSDITRSFVIGKATKEQENVYDLLITAKNKAIKEVRPGMNGKILDEHARKIIQKAGYGDYFQHSLGHGLGIAPHESPLITFRENHQIVPDGVVLSIEPGVYIEGKWGMRVEDNISVTVNGTESLTNAPLKLVSI